MRRVVTQGEHFSQTPFPTAKSHRIHHYGTRTIQGEHPSAGRRRLQATGGEQVLGEPQLEHLPTAQRAPKSR